MERCTVCVLPETFPGIKFNKKGVCNYCVNFKGEKRLEEKKQKYGRKFEVLIREYRGKKTYDALLSYSGGKDSTYTLHVVREEYGLNILAVTFDNGFLPEQTYKNIRSTTDLLSIDHIFLKPRFDILKKIFVECSKKNIFSSAAIKRASNICTACIAMVKYSALRMALEKDIPLIIYGWSPGQIPISSSVLKNNPEMTKKAQRNLLDPLHTIIGKEIKPYFLENKFFDGSYIFPYNISPLLFLDYDEKKIMRRISQIEWKIPNKIDANTTNCYLNSFANTIHKEQYNYHPYVFELANLVRIGILKRNAALERLKKSEDLNTVKLVREKLGL